MFSSSFAAQTTNTSTYQVDLDFSNPNHLFIIAMNAYDREDYTKARWLQKSAALGYAEAQYNLAVMYRQGLGDDQGVLQAQYNLGSMYEQGYGTPKNEQEAFQAYKKATDQGYAKAQYKIGIMYLDGLGTKKDLLLASQSFKTAYEIQSNSFQ
jgi:uncharacterized protein